MKIGNWTGARKEWEATVMCEPQNAAAHSNLGKVLHHLREYEAAAISLERAVALKPSLGDTWITLGLTYQELKAPMRAVSCLTRAVHESPADPQTHNALGIVLKKMGWTGAAESELQKAIDLEPKFADAHFNLAAMYLERKPPSLEMARRHYGAALELGVPRDETMEQQLSGEEPVVEEVDRAAATAVTEDTGAEPEAKAVPATPVRKPSAKPKKQQ